MWQWRHNTSFSMMKKARMPPSTVAVVVDASPLAVIACGSTSRKDAPSRAPMA